MSNACNIDLADCGWHVILARVCFSAFAVNWLWHAQSTATHIRLPPMIPLPSCPTGEGEARGVEGQVQQLLLDAQNPDSLCRMYIGCASVQLLHASAAFGPEGKAGLHTCIGCIPASVGIS